MAMHVLENEFLKVSVADAGAELSSVIDKESGLERLHDANPQVWNRHAPILFPFVGKVVGGTYRIGDKEYDMKTQHGFARDMEFEFVEADAGHVVHRLLPNNDTRKIYPYEFELLVTHELDQENPRMVNVTWEVKNNGSDKMHYFIGGHPAFTTAESDPKAKEEYYLEFVGCDIIEYFGVSNETGFATPKNVTTVVLENGFLKFNEDVYVTLIFDNFKFDKVRICRPDKTPYVTMECSQFTSYGIWAKENGNFICLEPWAGRTDDDGFTGTIDEKIGVNTLEAGECGKICHSIEFHK